MQVFWVMSGGAVGALLRFAITQLIPQQKFPWATLVSNVASCVIFGLVLLFIKGLSFEKQLYLFLVTGLCGGFSTFSTFSFETFELMKQGQLGLAILNICSSILCCLFVFFVAYHLYSKNS